MRHDWCACVLLQCIIQWCLYGTAGSFPLQWLSPLLSSHSDHVKVLPEDNVPRHLGQILVNEKHKIAFCPIEKIASTQFRQLFQRLDGDPVWWEPPYHKKKGVRFSDMSIERVEEILHDDTWVKAVMFRDPARRLLSSYLHLVKNPNAIKRYRTMLAERHRNSTWTDFWQSVIAPNGIRNVHWDSQIQFCGLKKFWSRFNFVGNYELIQEHGEALTKIAGLDNFTSNGWAMTRLLKHPIAQTMPQEDKDIIISSLKPPDDYNKGDCMWCRNHAVHKNDYKKNPVSRYLTKDVWTYIRTSNVYQVDYDIFSKIKNPPFKFSIYDEYNYN